MPPHVVAEKSVRVIKRLMALEEYRNASTIMTYLDFRNEVQTGELVKKAMTEGKKVTVPLTDIASRRLMPSSLSHFPDDLQPGTWGILEPKPHCVRPVDPCELDLIIIPGVAFDEEGNRLGYGGGFYDRFLPRTRPGAVYVALAFEMQLRESVEHDDQDIKVHCLLTEERMIRVKKC